MNANAATLDLEVLILRSTYPLLGAQFRPCFSLQTFFFRPRVCHRWLEKRGLRRWRKMTQRSLIYPRVNACQEAKSLLRNFAICKFRIHLRPGRSLRPRERCDISYIRVVPSGVCCSSTHACITTPAKNLPWSTSCIGIAVAPARAAAPEACRLSLTGV